MKDILKKAAGKSIEVLDSLPNYIHKAAEFATEHAEGIITASIAIGYVYTLYTSNRYKNAQIELMKAETASKKAYAKHFGDR